VPEIGLGVKRGKGLCKIR